MARFLPFTAGQQLITVAGEASGGDRFEVDLFGRWPSGGVFAAFVALTLGAAWFLFRRHESDDGGSMRNGRRITGLAASVLATVAAAAALSPAASAPGVLAGYPWVGNPPAGATLAGNPWIGSPPAEVTLAGHPWAGVAPAEDDRDW